MSDPRLSVISESLGGAPDHLVERSAAARAAAQGTTLDDVLSAWAGSGPLPAPTAPTQVEPSPAAEPEPSPPVAEADFEIAAATVATAPEPVMEMEEKAEEEEMVVPASFRDRIGFSAKVGAGIGALVGIVSLAAMAPLALGRLTQTTSSGGPAIEVTATLVAAFALVWAAAGVIISFAAQGMGNFRSPAHGTDTGAMGLILAGGLSGLVMGAAFGSGLYAVSESSLSGTKLVSIGTGSLLGILAGFVVIGAIIGGISQAVSTPTALAGSAAEESRQVRTRLSDGLALPVVAMALIALIVVPFGSLLIRFAEYASLIAILVSIGTIGFAGLMASRPNLRVTRGEVLVAAAGIGVVLMMIALVAAALSEDEHEGDTAEHAPSSVVERIL